MYKSANVPIMYENLTPKSYRESAFQKIVVFAQ